MIPNIFNIQHFSTHDGPGIRTTIFFKGCPLRCAWCHNPESQLFTPEIMVDENGVREAVGREYSVDELIEDVTADEMIYDQSGGGVTLSGGEVLSQDRGFILELVRRLADREISIGIDTCGVAPTRMVEDICDDADFFLYDLKFISNALHKQHTGGSNHLVLRNLEVLSRRQARIVLRLIMLPGINMDKDTIERTMLWLRTHDIAIEQIDLLPYHTYGMNKYAKLGREVEYFEVPQEDELAGVKTQIERFYDNVTIGG
ncbi:radical SAM protein [Bifidobacterium subtile]|jgi:pyruvate formate lyase activating enzyme|uniref:Glycyl radical activating protein n=1 Tax=Bifidobacterium subtile TaxID=77635 RepID=A0A087E583_9BIFI|nr:radical SAM protein [Bifidobacterium subtile]KFJ02934.1 glycyl radical activating protein [Bifidobacterium subtile]QOL36544.1 radical SAM protein [Bifidobacterium subtile]